MLAYTALSDRVECEYGLLGSSVSSSNEVQRERNKRLTKH